MTKIRFNSKRITAFLLCLIMVFMMFALLPTQASATALQAPTNFAYNPSTRLFSWFHPGAHDLTITYVIRNEHGDTLWTGSMPQHGVPITELSLFDAVGGTTQAWSGQNLPNLTAHVVARRNIGTGIETSGMSNPFTVAPIADPTLNHSISIVDGTRLVWTPHTQQARPPLIFRIYVNGLFTRTVDSRIDFNLAELNLPIAQPATIAVRAVNPGGFAISDFSNNVPFLTVGQPFPIIVSSVGAGSVSQNVTSAIPGTTVTVTATPNPGANSFTRWEVLAGDITIETYRSHVSFTMPPGEVRLQARFDTGNLINIIRNNDAMGTATADVSRAQPFQTVTLAATPAAGNRFVRWEVVAGTLTLANPESTDSQFIMPNSDITVRAVFEVGQGVTAGNLGQVYIQHTQSAGDVTLDLPVARITEIVNASTAGGHAIFDLSRLSNVSTVTMPRAALNEFVIRNIGIELRMAEGTAQRSIRLDRAALQSLASQAQGINVSITMQVVGRAGLSAAQQGVVAIQDTVYRFGLSSVGQLITNIDGVIQITAPYLGTTPAGVWRLGDQAQLDPIDRTYNESARTVTFRPPFPALYVVGNQRSHPSANRPPLVDAPTNSPFTDVRQSDWFFSNVLWAHANNLMGTTVANQMVFSPNTHINRAMVATILHRFAGTPAPAGTVSFSDVNRNEDGTVPWFYYASLWVAESNILGGVGGGRFQPGAVISRQDLAVVLMRYADFMGIELRANQPLRTFVDDAQIHFDARASVRRAVEAGVFTGDHLNRFNPAGNTTRAEFATVLFRYFVEAPLNW